MAKLKIIMDTNVLYSGLYSIRGASYFILRAIERGKIKLILSTTLLFEYEDVLKRSKSVLGLSIREINMLLDNLCQLGDHQKIHFLWRPLLPDQKDDHILELAVGSGAKTILTHNIKDFAGIRQFGIRAITPKILLEEIK